MVRTPTAYTVQLIIPLFIGVAIALWASYWYADKIAPVIGALSMVCYVVNSNWPTTPKQAALSNISRTITWLLGLLGVNTAMQCSRQAYLDWKAEKAEKRKAQRAEQAKQRRRKEWQKQEDTQWTKMVDAMEAVKVRVEDISERIVNMRRPGVNKSQKAWRTGGCGGAARCSSGQGSAPTTRLAVARVALALVGASDVAALDDASLRARLLLADRAFRAAVDVRIEGHVATDLARRGIPDCANLY
ncbi:hypothetical protein PRIPAC_76231 [Pristionchus pacificus]|uniref:Uncharacterized protein n=1 Tax=Pristionchus pacificus TaxID=54126 RepID=A0A2A6CFP0_PRIPA|nr:hypothetical protein PRIPAC_76231 [Pristionchus pacificus]|eukprot:PDM76831.1 hypothetical protein PRIPAC_42226 [Pristionchus pacificus]